jgi:hypothetical protein
MSESPLTPELTAPYDSPLGAVELTSSATFGMREAVLAGVAVSPSAAAGRGGVFADASGLAAWPTHITCSITVKTGDD